LGNQLLVPLLLPLVIQGSPGLERPDNTCRSHLKTTKFLGTANLHRRLHLHHNLLQIRNLCGLGARSGRLLSPLRHLHLLPRLRTQAVVMVGTKVRKATRRKKPKMTQ